jgi:serine/threonine protein phosphatase PrpC
VPGAAESLGRRATGEDSVAGDGKTWSAVFDGHGGRNAALLAAAALPIQWGLKNNAKDSLANLHRLIVKTKLKAGTTGVVGQVLPDELRVTWVGDSRGLLIRKDCSYLRLSFDHRPSRPDEAKRVQAMGGRISAASSGSRGKGESRGEGVSTNPLFRVTD